MRRILMTMIMVAVALIPAFAVLTADSAAYRMELQRYLYPQEKIHVTTDQGRYVAGDTVWLRAFVVDAASHRPLTLSRYVYVELQNPMGDTETRIKLRHDSAGVFAGYLALSDELPEGDYTMHAYTDFMENQGSGYYFRKRLPVMSPLSGRAVIRSSVEPGSDRLTLYVADNSAPDVPVYFKEMILTTSEGRQIMRGPAKKAETVALRPEELRSGVALVRFDNYARYIGLPGPVCDSISVGFYPEGGYLVPGEANRVGVKLLDSNGRGIDATGTVYDSHNNPVATFTTVHSGMGTLMLIPQSGESYTAEIGGHRYALPPVNTDAAVVRAEVHGRGYIAVSTGGMVPEGSSIFAHNRGRLLYAGSAPHADSPLLFPRNDIGDGVVSLLLLDGSGNTLSERLVFAWPDSMSVVRPDVSVSDGGKGLKHVHIRLPEGSDCAVSVIDGALAETDTATTIASTLLLQSDLSGHIEDAGWYFRGGRDRKKESAMDALMLTQGWRRYDIPAVLRGETSDPQLPLEQGSEISGTVRTLWRNRPIAGAQVNLLAPTLNLARVAITDSAGRFSVSDVEFPEGTRFVVQSLNRKGGYEQNFTVDTVAYPTLRQLWMPVQALRGDEVRYDVSVPKDYTARMHYADGHYEVRLSDVTVQGYRQQDVDDPYQLLASKSIDITKLEKEENLTTYEEILRKIPGIKIRDNKITFRKEPVSFWINGRTKLDPNIDLSYTKTEDKIDLNFSPYELKVLNIKPPKGEIMPTNADYSVLDHLRDAYPIQDIKRVDFIPPGMAMAFQTHGVVINLITRGPSDNLNDRSVHMKIISPLGFQTPKEFYHQDYATVLSPDLRSTLYWLPKVSGDTILNIPAYVSPIILIEGVNKTGLVEY